MNQSKTDIFADIQSKIDEHVRYQKENISYPKDVVLKSVEVSQKIEAIVQDYKKVARFKHDDFEHEILIDFGDAPNGYLVLPGTALAFIFFKQGLVGMAHESGGYVTEKMFLDTWSDVFSRYAASDILKFVEDALKNYYQKTIDVPIDVFIEKQKELRTAYGSIDETQVLLQAMVFKPFVLRNPTDNLEELNYQSMNGEYFVKQKNISSLVPLFNKIILPKAELSKKILIFGPLVFAVLSCIFLNMFGIFPDSPFRDAGIIMAGGIVGMIFFNWANSVRKKSFEELLLLLENLNGVYLHSHLNKRDIEFSDSPLGEEVFISHEYIYNAVVEKLLSTLPYKTHVLFLSGLIGLVYKESNFLKKISQRNMIHQKNRNDLNEIFSKTM